MGRCFVTIDRILYSARPQFSRSDLGTVDVGGIVRSPLIVGVATIALVIDGVAVRVGPGSEMVGVVDVAGVGLIVLRSVMS